MDRGGEVGVLTRGVWIGFLSIPIRKPPGDVEAGGGLDGCTETQRWLPLSRPQCSSTAAPRMP
jgi:hypothetical protein